MSQPAKLDVLLFRLGPLAPSTTGTIRTITWLSGQSLIGSLSTTTGTIRSTASWTTWTTGQCVIGFVGHLTLLVKLWLCLYLYLAIAVDEFVEILVSEVDSFRKGQ